MITDANQRAFAQILKGCGVRVAPVMPSVLSSTPSTVEKLNFCSKLTKNRKSSILAKPSPRHARLPRKRNDIMYYICIHFKNLLQVENAGSVVITCWEGQKCISPHKLSLSIQEVLRVKHIRCFPLVFIEEDRGQVWHHCGSLNTSLVSIEHYWMHS